MIDLKKVVGLVAVKAKAKAPEMLMMAGAMGFGATVVMAVQASPKAEERFYEGERRARRISNPVKARVYPYVYAAPAYLPAGIVGIGSLGCFFGAHHIHVERAAALASAYTMATQTLNAYQEKVIEKLGTDGHAELLDRVLADDDCQIDPVVEIDRAEGPVRCYDRVTGRYFESTPDRIRTAEGEIAKLLVDEMRVPLNRFYDLLGLPDFSFVGEAIGWDVERCRLDVTFRAMLDDDQTPCLALIYNTTVLDRNALRAG